MVQAYEPPNGTRDVDPALTKIVVRFDRPMNPNHYAVIRTKPELLPTIGRVGFDEAATIFTIEVQLKPDHDYEFSLNSEGPGSFASAEVVPLQPVRIRFHTKVGIPQQ